MTDEEVEIVVAIAERDRACLCLAFAEVPLVPLNPNARLADFIKPHPRCPLHKEMVNEWPLAGRRIMRAGGREAEATAALHPPTPKGDEPPHTK